MPMIRESPVTFTIKYDIVFKFDLVLDTSNPPAPEGMPLEEGILNADLGIDPRTHRLQRQDAKSRKTFKIKRHRSTIKANVMRSATVKGMHWFCILFVAP